MGLSASDEISTIEELKELKADGAPITNTVEDLDASIAENELAIVVFFTGAALTLPLVVASFLAVTGRAWVRVLATVFFVPPTAVIVFSVLHDIADPSRPCRRRTTRRTGSRRVISGLGGIWA